jgi:CPA2 family monovalent cation:H+ antiporter-2
VLAGAVLGPYRLGLVRDVAVVEGLADLGVVLLLFTVGLELSVGSLRSPRQAGLDRRADQVLGTIALVLAVSRAAGESVPRGLFFGYLVALSSTAIVLKLLVDRREVDSPHGRFLVAILILQDLAVVPMLVSLNVLAGHARGGALTAAGGLRDHRADGGARSSCRARSPCPASSARWPERARRRSSSSPSCFLVLGSAVATSWAGVSAALGAFPRGSGSLGLGVRPPGARGHRRVPRRLRRDLLRVDRHAVRLARARAEPSPSRSSSA